MPGKGIKTTEASTIIDSIRRGDLSGEMKYLHQLRCGKTKAANEVYDGALKQIVDEQVQEWGEIRYGNAPRLAMLDEERARALGLIRDTFCRLIHKKELRWLDAGQEPSDQWRICLTARHPDGERNSLAAILAHVATSCCTRWGLRRVPIE